MWNSGPSHIFGETSKIVRGEKNPTNLLPHVFIVTWIKQWRIDNQIVTIFQNSEGQSGD